MNWARETWRLFVGAFAATLAVFIAMAMPPGAWGAITVIAVGAVALIAILCFVGWLIALNQRGQRQLLAALVADRKDERQVYREVINSLSEHDIANIEQRILQGVRVMQDQHGRYLLDIPGRGLLPAAQANMSAEAINYAIELQDEIDNQIQPLQQQLPAPRRRPRAG